MTRIKKGRMNSICPVCGGIKDSRARVCKKCEPLVREPGGHMPILNRCKLCKRSFNDVKRKIQKSKQPKGFTEFNYCEECFKEIKRKDNRQYYQRNKDSKYPKWRKNSLNRARQMKLDYVLRLGGKCQSCGYNDLSCVAVFDFHHTGDKEDNITNLINLYRGSKKGYGEVDKQIGDCIVLCSNCHRKIHFP